MVQSVIVDINDTTCTSAMPAVNYNLLALFQYSTVLTYVACRQRIIVKFQVIISG